RRHPALAASSSVAFVTLAAGLVVSLSLLDETRTALSGATAARASAAKSRESADELVQFMLGEQLQRQLASVGKSELLRAVAEKATAHFESIPSGELSDAELVTVADAWSSLGAAYETQGRREEQSKCRDRALAIRDSLHERNPADPAYARALAGSLLARGRRELTTGEFDASYASHQRV